MLRIRFLATDANVIEVIETSYTFTKTRERFWYYNLTTGKKSSNGRKGDPLDRDMTQSCRDWVEKHYLSKLV